MKSINLAWEIMGFCGVGAIIMIAIIAYTKNQYFDNPFEKERKERYEIETRYYFYVFAIFVVSFTIFAILAVIFKAFFETYFYWLALPWGVFTFILEALLSRKLTHSRIYKNHD